MNGTKTHTETLLFFRPTWCSSIDVSFFADPCLATLRLGKVGLRMVYVVFYPVFVCVSGAVSGRKITSTLT